MKQLPHISAALYGTPWAILPQTHIELGLLYHHYLRGTLPVPGAIAPAGEACHGVSWIADHASGIAILTLSGVICKRAPEMMCGPPMVDLAKLDAVLDEVAGDPMISTVVFDWDSPGGVAIGLVETSARMRDLARDKRLVAYTDVQMCSAAYWLATAADEIYCAPTAIIGSIGCYCAGLDDSRAWEMEGLELVLAKSGNLKALGHPGKAWTADERAWLQDMADKGGAEFRQQVTSRRGAVPDEAMQGQYFYARDAHPSLVDGYYNDLPALLADLMTAAV